MLGVSYEAHWTTEWALQQLREGQSHCEHCEITKALLLWPYSKKQRFGNVIMEIRAENSRSRAGKGMM